VTGAGTVLRLNKTTAGHSLAREVRIVGMMSWMMGVLTMWMMFFGGMSFWPFGLGVR